MKGFYEKLLDGRIVDRPPCSRCLHRNKMTVEEPCYSCIDLMDLSLHRNKMTVEEPCYSCIDLMDLSLHRPNVETKFASFTPATEVNHEE